MCGEDDSAYVPSLLGNWLPWGVTQGYYLYIYTFLVTPLFLAISIPAIHVLQSTSNLRNRISHRTVTAIYSYHETPPRPRYHDGSSRLRRTSRDDYSDTPNTGSIAIANRGAAHVQSDVCARGEARALWKGVVGGEERGELIP
jgi:hypothetical protein